MTDAVTAKVAEWETLVEGATPGPWDTDGGGTSIGHGDKWVAHVVDHQEPNEPVQARADAEFIAHARTAMPALLGFVREVREGHEPMDWCPNPRHDAEGVCPECVVTCTKDGLDWPCHTEQAAQKWIGGQV